MAKLISWLRKYYNLSIHSIGFYPALLSLVFLLLFIITYQIEETAGVIKLKQRFLWMNLKNSEAARAIITTVATGIIGLTVFSFSMVMLVMSQAASQMSNRLLDNLIGNKFQKITLGFYLGTILAAFFLLTVVDDKGTSQVPSLSVFLLVLVTLTDLFLFVSFLHYITQSVRFERLIKTIHEKTTHSMQNFYTEREDVQWAPGQTQTIEILSPLSGYFQGINRKQMLNMAQENDWKLQFYPFRCTYVIRGEPLLKLHYQTKPGDKNLKYLFTCIDFYTGQEIDKNPFYGFLHLSEIAIKALSPGINDPNTAVLSLHALTDLLACKIKTNPCQVFTDRQQTARVFIPERSFTDLFSYCIYPILDYGKKDRFMKSAFSRMIQQLKLSDPEKRYWPQLDAFKEECQKES